MLLVLLSNTQASGTTRPVFEQGQEMSQTAFTHSDTIGDTTELHRIFFSTLPTATANLDTKHHSFKCILRYLHVDAEKNYRCKETVRLLNSFAILLHPSTIGYYIFTLEKILI